MTKSPFVILLCAGVMLSCRSSPSSGPADLRVVAWGAQDPALNRAQAVVPPDLKGVTAVAAGEYHTLALISEGKVVAWGDNEFGQLAVPSDLSNVVAISAGGARNLALSSQGQLREWGDSWRHRSQLPPVLSNVIAVSAGRLHNLALTRDGVLHAWGINDDGENDVPAGLGDVVAISSGDCFSLALRANGTIQAWGCNSWGQLNIPHGLTHVVAIAASNAHCLALTNEGKVHAWGCNNYGQTNVPSDLNRVVAISAGGAHSVALTADGTVHAWGNNSSGQSSVPVGLSNVTAIAAGGFHNVALTGGKPLVFPPTRPSIPAEGEKRAEGGEAGEAVNEVTQPARSSCPQQEYVGKWTNKKDNFNFSGFGLRQDGRGRFSAAIGTTPLRWRRTGDAIHFEIAGGGQTINMELRCVPESGVLVGVSDGRVTETFYRVSEEEPSDYEAELEAKREQEYLAAVKSAPTPTAVATLEALNARVSSFIRDSESLRWLTIAFPNKKGVGVDSMQHGATCAMRLTISMAGSARSHAKSVSSKEPPAGEFDTHVFIADDQVASLEAWLRQRHIKSDTGYDVYQSLWRTEGYRKYWHITALDSHPEDCMVLFAMVLEKAVSPFEFPVEVREVRKDSGAHQPELATPEVGK